MIITVGKLCGAPAGQQQREAKSLMADRSELQPEGRQRGEVHPRWIRQVVAPAGSSPGATMDWPVGSDRESEAGHGLSTGEAQTGAWARYGPAQLGRTALNGQGAQPTMTAHRAIARPQRTQ